MKKLIITALALALLLPAGAQTRKKAKPLPLPDISVTRQSGTTIPFLGIPLNDRRETYSVGKSGFQVKRSQGDWLNRSGFRAGVNNRGKVRIEERNVKSWPW